MNLSGFATKFRPTRLTASPAVLICALAALLACIVGFGYYNLATDQYKSNRRAGNTAVLALVDAFFSTYSDIRSQAAVPELPVPATFRAHALEAFNRNRSSSDAIRLTMVGYPGREIRTKATDENMREAMRSFVIASDTEPLVSLIELEGEPVLRTILPSIAKRESCVACHNSHAPKTAQWHLGDVMGAFVFDAPAGSALQKFLLQSVGLGVLAFLLTLGLTSIAYFQYMRRAAIVAQEQSYSRLDDAIDAIESGFAIRDKDSSLVVKNRAYSSWLENSRRPPNDHPEGSGLEMKEGDHRRHEVQLGAEWYESYATRTSSGDLVEIVTNITDRKNQEFALRRAKEVAENTVGRELQFSASKGNEIRTALKAVLGKTSLLLESKLDNSQREWVQRIQDSGNALLSISGDALGPSKIEAEGMELEDNDFDLNSVLHHVVAHWAPQIEAKGLRCEQDFDRITHPILRTDPTCIRQVLSHLISNALKYTDHGAIAIRAAQFERPDGLIETGFSVTDSGIGIAPDQQSTLFETPKKTNGSISDRGDEPSLGLALSKKLAETKGGTMGGESTPGEGSTFWFTIVCPEGSPDLAGKSTIDAAIAFPTDQPRLRILLAEDDHVNQNLIVSTLRAGGHLTDVVNDGMEAISALMRCTYDLVLMDVQMPHLDGISATQRIRSLAGAPSQVPIVALTANTMKGDRERYLAVGMNDFVPKPIDRQRLIDAVMRQTSGTTTSAAVDGGREASAPEVSSEPTAEPSASQGSVTSSEPKAEDSGSSLERPKALPETLSDGEALKALLNELGTVERTKRIAS